MSCDDGETNELELARTISADPARTINADSSDRTIPVSVESSEAKTPLSLIRMAHERPMTTFNFSIGVLIVANAIVMGVETDNDIGDVGDVLENFFTAMWTIEILVRNIAMTPRGYFLNGWCLMDFCLAWLSILSLWILPAAGGQEGSGLRLLSVLRILRLLRVLRLVKFLKLFRGLLLLVYGLAKALAVLTWVVVLLLIVVYVTALLMTNVVGHRCDSTYADFHLCQEMFGTLPESMYTMFQVITLESWSMAVARPILRENPAFIVLFLFFLYITTFGLLNVVMGVIVDQTLQVSADDEVRKQGRLMKEKSERALRLRGLFTDADVNSDGFVSLEEFMDKCKTQDVIDDFRNLNLQVTPPDAAKRLFNILDFTGRGQLEINNLIRRTQHLLGEGISMTENRCHFLTEIRRAASRMECATKRVKPAAVRLETNDILQAITKMESSISNQLAQFEDKFHARGQRIEVDRRPASL